ncbi:MAG: heavy metal-binding domain-containing protein [Ignavibacteriales bacterium]
MSVKKVSFFASVLVISVLFITGCGGKREETQNNTQKQDTHQVQANNNTSLSANTIVREGEIDVKAIDKNNDGKVFECSMDYNVISDTKGSCPKCGMDLDEVTIDKARENLKNSGFKTK